MDNFNKGYRLARFIYVHGGVLIDYIERVPADLLGGYRAYMARHV